jgi:uncharacterized membrane protein YidH (DUF202 family)
MGTGDRGLVWKLGGNMIALLAILLAILLIVIRIAIVALAGYITMLNLNDIISYINAHEYVPFWPIVWILLALSLVIGSNTTAVNKK